MNAGAPAIAVRNLTKAFGATTAVDDLSFDIAPGVVTGFLGPNGAGKSTTLRAILGLVAPTSGEATVLGRRYAELEEPARSVGALLETQQFHPQRTGRNHLAVLAAASGFGHDRVEEVLHEVELTHAAGRKVGGYSLGMRQRLGLAAAMLGDPGVLILDEPANGLDPAGMRWLRGLLRSYARRGRAVFVSSHLLDEVAHIADEVVVVNKGRLVVHASIEELRARASRGMRITTPEPERMRHAFERAGIEALQPSESDVLVRAGAETAWEVAAGAGLMVTGLREESLNLEEVFFELTETVREA
ncbi:MAG TPA: ATP-binding cassette domain-containing protein [Actinomycetota bacterium]|nr:ATP-binding cassette domain-containing protein [Actinomycetota bacterium]